MLGMCFGFLFSFFIVYYSLSFITKAICKASSTGHNCAVVFVVVILHCQPYLLTL